MCRRTDSCAGVGWWMLRYSSPCWRTISATSNRGLSLPMVAMASTQDCRGRRAEQIERAGRPADVFDADVRVDLGRTQGAMTEKDLDQVDVVAGFEQVRGEAVSQHVRRHLLLDPARGKHLSEDKADGVGRGVASLG